MKKPNRISEIQFVLFFLLILTFPESALLTSSPKRFEGGVGSIILDPGGVYSSPENRYCRF